MSPVTLRALVLLLATTLLAASAALADEPGSREAKPDAEATTPINPPGSDGSGESVGVHGHWVIEVRNPDGSLATRREFDNALTDWGKTIFSRFLARTATVGLWNLQLAGTPSPCVLDTCLILDPRSAVPISPISGQNITKNLVVSGDPLKISGSLIALQAGSISSVAAASDFCSPAAPASCLGNANANTAFQFRTILALPVTSTSIAPVALQVGQQLQVSVTISFSTAP
jgi:hypothetical protein